MSITPTSLRVNVKARVAGFDSLPAGERVLQCMAYLADTVKVRESGGANRGQWVEAFLGNLGLGPGYAWCAASLAFACDAARVGRPKTGAAGVLNWWRWALGRGDGYAYLAKRGMACVRDSGGGKGHIGIVVKVVGPFVYSIEGNTGPGEEGNQRDGDGLYRRMRLKRFWNKGFIRLG